METCRRAGHGSSPPKLSSRWQQRWLRLVSVAVIAAAITSCGTQPPSTSAPSSVTLPLPTLTIGELDEARRFRETFGLRADGLWISLVAADPSNRASLEFFDVLVTPSELAELRNRTSRAVDVGVIIGEYGLTVPDDWHSSYIDQRTSTVMVEVYRNEALHRAELSKLLSPLARWKVVVVDPVIYEQIALVDRIKGDHAWFATIDAELMDVVTSTRDGGIVELTYRSERMDLAPLIRERYGDHDWFYVEWAGYPRWTGPVGDLVILAIDPDGRPVSGLFCKLGAGDTGLVTDAAGACRYAEVPAKEHRITLRGGGEGERYTAGSATFTAIADQVTTVRVVVDERP